MLWLFLPATIKMKVMAAVIHTPLTIVIIIATAAATITISIDLKMVCILNFVIIHCQNLVT